MSIGLATRGYFGGSVEVTGTIEPTPDPAPDAIPAPYEPSDIEYYDHVELAISRLSEQFKTKNI